MLDNAGRSNAHTRRRTSVSFESGSSGAPGASDGEMWSASAFFSSSAYFEICASFGSTKEKKMCIALNTKMEAFIKQIAPTVNFNPTPIEIKYKGPEVIETSKEEGWNPVFRLSREYNTFIHSVASDFKGMKSGELVMILKEGDTTHAVTNLKEKPVLVTSGDSSINEIYMAWMVTDILRLLGKEVRRQNFELHDATVEKSLRQRTAVLFAITRMRQKKSHNITKRIRRHGTLATALDRFQQDPNKLWN